MPSLHHTFDTELAEEYSIEVSLLIHHFQFWISRNRNLKRNFYEGRTWTYETIKEIKAHFPYFSVKQIERLLKKVVDIGIIVKGNFNKKTYDQTVWYAFKEEDKYLPVDKSKQEKNNSSWEIPKSGTAPTMEENLGKSSEIPPATGADPEIGKPIPDPFTDTNKESKPKKTQKPKKATLVSEDARKLSSLLLTSIKKLRPKFKEPNLNSWAEDIDKMLRIDKREVDEINSIIEWLPSCGFWAAKVLCGSKFRNHFDRLCIEKDSSKKQRKSVVKDFDNDYSEYE